MKKLTTIAAFALMISLSAFATKNNGTVPENETTVTKTVKEAFVMNFKGAENVKWNKLGDFYFADFNLKNETMSAAYNEEGLLIGMGKNLSFSQLPMAVQQSLQQQYGEYKIADTAAEVVYDGSTNYYIWADGAKKNLQLKCSSDGSISVAKTIKKKLVGRVY